METTNLNKLKIIQGSYNAVMNKLGDIEEKQLIIVDDKGLPIPTTDDSGKILSVNENGDYELAENQGGGGEIPIASRHNYGAVKAYVDDGYICIDAFDGTDYTAEIAYAQQQDLMNDISGTSSMGNEYTDAEIDEMNDILNNLTGGGAENE